MKIYIKIFALGLLVSGLVNNASAQQLNLQKGDKYVVVSALNSTVAMKRGNKQVDFKATSTMHKSYGITDATADGYQLTITTDKITDTLSAFNKKLAYSSTRKADPASDLETVLSNMVGQVQVINLDKSGKLVGIVDGAKANAADDAAAMAALPEKALEPGKVFDFGFSFAIPQDAVKGTKWTEALKVENGTGTITFTVDDKNAQTTRVSFVSEKTMPGLAIGANGGLLIDNATGVISDRVIQTNSVSNEVSADKQYLVSRKTILYESCKKAQ